jgi:hypothetical protein
VWEDMMWCKNIIKSSCKASHLCFCRLTRSKHVCFALLLIHQRLNLLDVSHFLFSFPTQLYFASSTTVFFTFMFRSKNHLEGAKTIVRDNQPFVFGDRRGTVL